MSCSKCNGPFNNTKEVVECSECKLKYHPTCSRIRTMDKFKSLSSAKKLSWKCDSCSMESSSNTSDPGTSAILDCIAKMRQELNTQFSGVNDNIKTQIASVNEKIEGLYIAMDALKNENEARKEQCIRLEQENQQLKEEVVELREQIYDIQQYSRRDNIEIVGVPYTQQEDVYCLLEKIAQVIHAPYDRAAISVAHRLPSSRKGRHPAIVVKFISRNTKDIWMRAARENRRNLTAAELCNSWESTWIYVNDHLTVNSKALLGRARELVREKRLAYAWTRDCRVLVRRTADSPVRLIRTMEDMRQTLGEDNNGQVTQPKLNS